MKNKAFKNILYVIIFIIFLIGIIVFIKNIGPRLVYGFIIWLGEDKI